MKRFQAGFTLIELMVVVVIVAILAAVALPAYTGQVKKGNRADMQGELQELALRLEQWRAQRFTYPDTTAFSAQFSVANDVYTVAYTPDADFQGWSMTASPKTGTIQENDGALILNSQGQSCYLPGASTCDPTNLGQNWSK